MVSSQRTTPTCLAPIEAPSGGRLSCQRQYQRPRGRSKSGSPRSRYRERRVLLDTTPEVLGAASRQALDDGASPFDLGLRIVRSARPTVADLGSLTVSMIQFELEDPPGA